MLSAISTAALSTSAASMAASCHLMAVSTVSRFSDGMSRLGGLRSYKLLFIMLVLHTYIQCLKYAKLNKSASDKHEHKHNTLKVRARTGMGEARCERAACTSYKLLRMPSHEFIRAVTPWGALVLEVTGRGRIGMLWSNTAAAGHGGDAAALVPRW